jgi:hypothetical protein
MSCDDSRRSNVLRRAGIDSGKLHGRKRQLTGNIDFADTSAEGFPSKAQRHLDHRPVVVVRNYVRGGHKDGVRSKPESSTGPVDARILGMIDRGEDERQRALRRPFDLGHVLYGHLYVFHRGRSPPFLA